MPEAVVVAASRSPIGRARKGSLTTMRGDDMGVQMISAALSQLPSFDPSQIDDVIVGCAQPAGEQGYNLGRLLAIELGLDSVAGTTVNRYCASSAQALRMAFHAIRSGEGNAFVVAGIESVSRYDRGKSDGAPDTRNPVFERAEERTRERSASNASWTDPAIAGDLSDPYIAMGETAENVASVYGIGRDRQDEWAYRSQQRVQKAREQGFWERDITPITLADGTIVAADDCPRDGVTPEGLAQLQPVFRAEGTVTAGNCCPLNDGAAALIVVSDDYASKNGLTPLARIVSTGISGVSPEIMGVGPIEATKRALLNAGLAIDDIDQLEINEAFASQVLASIDHIGIDPDRVNINGGAIALGHPFGQTGARIATTLIHSLTERGDRYGLETMCTAGGQGMAIVFERL